MSELRVCAYCGTEFVPNRNHQIYCCKKCNRLAYWKRAVTGDVPPTKLAAPPLTTWKSELPKAALEEMSNTPPAPKEEQDQEHLKKVLEEVQRRAQPSPLEKWLKGEEK